MQGMVDGDKPMGNDTHWAVRSQRIEMIPNYYG